MTYRPPDSRDEIFNKLSADVQANLPTTNPQKEKSWLRSVLAAFAGAFFDLYFQVTEAINTFFADTTYGVFLERKAANYGITRNPATVGLGEMTISGTPATAIPLGTALINADGEEYETKETKSITTDVDNVDLLTFAAGVATVTTPSAHNLVNGLTVTMAGATPTGLNGAVPVKAVTGEKTFTYDASAVVGSGTATGLITVTSAKAVISTESALPGLDKNMNLNETLTIQTPISGVDSSGKVNFEQISGGSDLESDDSLKQRLIFRLQNPVTLFNAAQIETIARTFDFIKRVFVFNITPSPGQTTVYLLKDNNELPTNTELTLVKDEIVATILPANTAAFDLFVLAPTQVVTNFELTGILPNTDTMKTSIQNRLIEFFRTGPVVSEDVKENEYICVIQSTIDLETGELLEDFTLNNPSGDLTVADGEIATLGTVTFV